MFYADDLTLFATDAYALRGMLRVLEEYSQKKGLTVNASKSYIMEFNGRPGTNEFKYKDKVIETVTEFKYLGVVFNRDGSMKHADRQMSRVFWSAHTHGIKKRLDMMLSLYRTYIVPSGLYAAQIWASPYLSLDEECTNVCASRVQKQHLSYLRCLLGARRATPKWALLK
jgi:hypothetical protein